MKIWEIILSSSKKKNVITFLIFSLYQNCVLSLYGHIKYFISIPQPLLNYSNGADEMAAVHFQLWGDECDSFEAGDILVLTNDIFSYNRNNLVLRAGKRGNVKKVGEFCMAFVETPNLSEIRWGPDPSDPKKFVQLYIVSPVSRIFPPLPWFSFRLLLLFCYNFIDTCCTILWMMDSCVENGYLSLGCTEHDTWNIWEIGMTIECFWVEVWMHWVLQFFEILYLRICGNLHCCCQVRPNEGWAHSWQFTCQLLILGTHLISWYDLEIIISIIRGSITMILLIAVLLFGYKLNNKYHMRRVEGRWN